MVVRFESMMVSKCPGIARIYACLERFAGAHLFPDSFIDEHVGIDRHTNGEHNTRESRKGQRCPGIRQAQRECSRMFSTRAILATIPDNR